MLFSYLVIEMYPVSAKSMSELLVDGLQAGCTFLYTQVHVFGGLEKGKEE